MKRIVFFFITLLVISFLGGSCKNKTIKEGQKTAVPGVEISPGMISIGKDIITEVILNPDTLGDPWEAEKIKNYNGKLLYKSLFENIYNKKVIVYDVFTDKPLTPEDVKSVEKEYNSDISRIGKLQFLEDWYFDPVTSKIIKQIKSVTFSYSIQRGPGLPTGYKALFKLKVNY
jgi:hypothetical protein